MEANALEKIYLFENPISGTLDDRWLSKRSDDTDIEYTRTDVVIEKVCEWLKENAHKYTEKVDTIFGTIKVLNSHKLANDLKQAMKDE